MSRKIIRNTVTGQFTDEAEAAANPRETVKETVADSNKELVEAAREVLPILYRAVEFSEKASDDYKAYDRLCKLVEGK